MSRTPALRNYSPLFYAAMLLVVSVSTSISAHATGISGRVMNQTTGKPSAGDEVLLLRLGDGMEPVEQTHTDAQGVFSFAADGAAGGYVVRVLHQGVNYDQKLSNAMPVEMAVFDAVAKVRDIAGTMGIAQIESDGKDLKVTEMYSISNVSNPPVTQANPRNFEISLPEHAALDVFQVKRAGGVWVNQSPTPVAGSKNHFAVDFPLRPGDTLFKFTYRLPQQDRTALKIHLAYPVRNFGVVHPPSMTFKSSRAKAFTSPGVIKGLKLERLVADDMIRDVPAFELAGVGAAPVETPSTQAPPSAIESSRAEPVAPAIHVTEAGNPPEKPGNELWVIIAATVVLIFAGVMYIARKRRRVATPAVDFDHDESVVDAIRDELSQLEKEKLYGAISGEEYDSAKQALSLNLERATARARQ